MTFLLKRPFIIIIVIIIAAIILIYTSGLFTTKEPGLTISSTQLESNPIQIGLNTTLSVVIENHASQTKQFELHIIYTTENLLFYDKITQNRLPEPIQTPDNYTIVYPTSETLDIYGRIEVPILITGSTSFKSQTYTVFLQVYTIEGHRKVLTDIKSIQLIIENPSV